jgi:SAM-dependent methyltransferase
MDTFFARFFPHDGGAVEGYHAALRARLGTANRVLDLGCGDNVGLAPYRTPGREVWGVDVQRHPQLTSPEWFRLLGPQGRVPFPDAAFDLIASRWVLEHIEDPAAFLSEVSRLLRPGGSFVSLTVNAWHYVAWLSRLLGILPHAITQRLVQRLYGRPAHDTFPTYYRLNTPGQFRRTVRRAGLELEAVVHFANPDYFRFSPLLRRTAIVCDWLLERAAQGLGRVYLLVALRKAERIRPEPATWHRLPTTQRPAA